MTPGERDWTERMVAQWGEAAAQMRRIACTRESIITRAGALDSVVARLQARLDAAPAPVVASAAVIVAPSALPVSIARRQHLEEMAAYRAARAAGAPPRPPGRNFFAEMAAIARGEADRVYRRGNSPPPTPLPIVPPPVAAPFVAGPQMSFDL